MLEWKWEWIQGIREGNAMPLVSVPAVYDGRTITLLEAPPSREPYRVLVTFVERADEADARDRPALGFAASFGAWRDDRPVEATLAEHTREPALANRAAVVMIYLLDTDTGC